MRRQLIVRIDNSFVMLADNCEVNPDGGELETDRMVCCDDPAAAPALITITRQVRKAKLNCITRLIFSRLVDK